MSWKFWKKDPNPMDPQVLLAQAEAARPQDRVQDTVPGVGGAFQLPIEDIFSITGRGTVVTGRISHGVIRVGDQVLVTRGGQPVVSTRVIAVEAFRKVLNEARAGDNVGLILEGVEKGQLQQGDVVTY